MNFASLHALPHQTDAIRPLLAAGPIDRVEVAIARKAWLRTSVRRDFSRPDLLSRSRQIQYFSSIHDLRPLGLPCVLLFESKRTGCHALEFMQAARLTLRNMAEIIERVFEVDGAAMPFRRLDIAVDIRGTDVGWFRSHLRVPRKRNCKEYYAPRQTASRSGTTQTMYIGASDDMFRIYDKAAERAKRALAGAVIPKEVCTRLEHQMRTGKIPSDINTIGGLLKNAASLRPFEALVYEDLPGISPADCNDLGASTYLKASGYERHVEEFGLQLTHQLIKKKSAGNASRLMASIAGRKTDKAKRMSELVQSSYLNAIAIQTES
jgi:hypothetical protein